MSTRYKLSSDVTVLVDVGLGDESVLVNDVSDSGLSYYLSTGVNSPFGGSEGVLRMCGKAGNPLLTRLRFKVMSNYALEKGGTFRGGSVKKIGIRFYKISKSEKNDLKRFIQQEGSPFVSFRAVRQSDTLIRFSRRSKINRAYTFNGYVY